MNKRQHKKVMCSLVAKLLAAKAYPQLRELKPTRPEFKLFNNQRSSVSAMYNEALKSLNENKLNGL